LENTSTLLSSSDPCHSPREPWVVGVRFTAEQVEVPQEAGHSRPRPKSLLEGHAENHTPLDPVGPVEPKPPCCSLPEQQSLILSRDAGRRPPRALGHPGMVLYQSLLKRNRRSWLSCWLRRSCSQGGGRGEDSPCLERGEGASSYVPVTHGSHWPLTLCCHLVLAGLPAALSPRPPLPVHGSERWKEPRALLTFRFSLDEVAVPGWPLRLIYTQGVDMEPFPGRSVHRLGEDPAGVTGSQTWPGWTEAK
jgi:hypothetical protein